MSIPDFTTVLGVDAAHVDHLVAVFPNWVARRPNTILDRPLVVFYDTDMKPEQLNRVRAAILDHTRASLVPWPPPETHYEDDPSSRFGKSQRYKMLAGFVHVPVFAVKTPYWLKLDLDTVATGGDDWIQPEWFDGEAVIVASAWGYTKPADQMMKLDEWVANHAEELPALSHEQPLNLKPRPGSPMVKHRRIISWAAFFHTGFTRFAAAAAKATCGDGKLPVPSQDGFLWYCAERSGLYYRTVAMKDHGWAHCSGFSSVKSKIAEVQSGK